MRRLNASAAFDTPEALVDPGEIISRAATAAKGEDAPPGHPRAQANRRARRRWRDLARPAWHYGSRALALALLLATVIGGPLWAWRSGVHLPALRHLAGIYQGWLHQADRRFALAIEHIIIEGRQRTPRDAVRGALGTRRHDSLLAADPWAIRRRLEALPWVKRASVERRYPATLRVALVERVAIARYRDATGVRLVDEAGAIFAAEPEAEHEKLPLLAGGGAPAAAPALLRLLAGERSLERRVLVATRQGNRRWDVAFEGGATLKLPEGHERAAWTKFAELERQHGLLGRGGVTYDMRLPDRLVIRAALSRNATPPGAPADKPPSGKKPPKSG